LIQPFLSATGIDSAVAQSMNAGFIYTWEYIIIGGTYVPTACDNTKQLLSYSVTGAVTPKYELGNFRSHCCPLPKRVLTDTETYTQMTDRQT